MKFQKQNVIMIQIVLSSIYLENKYYANEYKFEKLNGDWAQSPILNKLFKKYMIYIYINFKIL